MNTEQKLQTRTRNALLKALDGPLVLERDIPDIGYDFSVIEDDEALWDLMGRWKQAKVGAVAVDLEFETCMHYRDLHQVCTIQVYDGTKYYLLDGIKLTRTKAGLAAAPGSKAAKEKVAKGALKAFLESQDIVKVMFSCSNDSAIMRKHGITLNNAYDVQRLGNMAALRGLSLVTFISVFLGLNIEDGKVVSTTQEQDEKKKMMMMAGAKKGGNNSDEALAAEMKKHKSRCQMFDWTSRPVPGKQVVYALADVEYLFSLKDAILCDIKSNSGSSAVKYAEELAAFDNGAYVVAKPKSDLDFVPGYERFNSDSRKIANCVYIQASLIAKERLKRFTEFLPLKGVVGIANKISTDGADGLTVPYVLGLFSSKEKDLATILVNKLKDIYKSKEPKGSPSTQVVTSRAIQKAKSNMTITARRTFSAKNSFAKKGADFGKRGFSKKTSAPPNKRIKFN